MSERDESLIIKQVRELTHELEKKEYAVILSLAGSIELEAHLRLSYGVVEYPDKDSEMRDIYSGYLLDTVDRIREGLSVYGDEDYLYNLPDTLPITIQFRQTEMDFINMVFEKNINDCRANKEQSDPDSNLRILTMSIPFMGEVNRAFIASGAPVSALFSQYFEAASLAA